MKRIALLGECLIELNGKPFGLLQQSFGGDSLNTAVYLARLTRGATEVKYISALGTDALSSGLLERWAEEGIDTQLVLRDPARLPGMYLIQTDAQGERTFLYWRGQSAARYLLQHPEFERVAAELKKVDMIFVTGISLAILPAEDRSKLIDLLKLHAAKGVAIAFDTNYRSRLWPSPEEARAVIQALLPIATIMFATFDDEQQLWGDQTTHNTITRLRTFYSQLLILKVGAEGCLLVDGKTVTPVNNIIDTTAAGDAFNAAFIAAWIKQRPITECGRAGNALAGTVIQHRGAIIPPSVTLPLADLLKGR
jgi:2-dehydro-3-deoxygluconokinase